MMMKKKEALSFLVWRLRAAIERKKQKEGNKKRKLHAEDSWEDQSQREEKGKRRRRSSWDINIGGKDDIQSFIQPSKLLLLQNKDAASRFHPRVGINSNLPRRKRPTLMLSVEETINSKVAKPKDEVEPPNEESSSIPVPNLELDVVDVVDVEWWDLPFQQHKQQEKMMTLYVEHPRPIEPPPGSEAAPSPPQPLKLTNHERKKLRTQKRLARQKDIQHMIRLGVLEPPKPTLKLTNIIKLGLGTQDPTRLEMEIRRAAAEREQAHMDRNISRKLTPEELRQKKARKLFDHHSISTNTIVSVYKLINVDLSRHPQARFKVDINAQQNNLTGCATTLPSSNKGCVRSVVVVEGCNKSINRYKKLMLDRIDWTAATNDEDKDENIDDNKCKCVLVWEGSVATPNFTKFMVQGCTTEAAASKFFSDHGIAHYFDSINSKHD